MMAKQESSKACFAIKNNLIHEKLKKRRK